MKKLISLLLALLLTTTLAIPAMATATPKYKSEAEVLYDLGLFKGTGTNPDGTPIFSLENNATRLQALIMLIRLLGEEDEALATTTPNPFTDIDSNSVGAKYAAYAYETGITKGIGNNQFGNKLVTPSQYLTFVLRALGYNDSQGDFTVGTAIRKARKIGLISDDMLTDGKNTLLRDECAKISLNALGTPLKSTDMYLAEKLVNDKVLTSKAVDDAGIIPQTVYIPCVKNGGRFEFEVSALLEAFPAAAFIESAERETDHAEERLSQGDFSPQAILLRAGHTRLYCSGIYDSIGTGRELTGKETFRCTNNYYATFAVMDADYRLLAYAIVPPNMSGGKIAFIPCFYDGAEEIEQRKSDSISAVKNAVQVDASAFSVENKTLKVDASKLPEKAKDFKYYAYETKSGNASTLEIAVRAAWCKVESDLTVDSDEYSPYHEFGTSDSKMDKLKSNRLLLLYNADKQLVAYSLLP